jgi:hypothetical protein
MRWDGLASLYEWQKNLANNDGIKPDKRAYYKNRCDKMLIIHESCP